MAQWSDDDVAALLRELGSHGFGGINPDEGQLRTLLESGEDGPLQFANLLSYHADACYPEGHELARAGLVSRARVSQILKLLTLAPSIQEFILEMPPRIAGKEGLTERDLRKVVREPLWYDQRVFFEKL